MQRSATVILFGATNQKFGGGTTLDLLAEKLGSTCVVIPISGVGVPQVEDNRCTKSDHYILVLITGGEEKYYQHTDISPPLSLPSFIDP